jgi:hypothetical protein
MVRWIKLKEFDLNADVYVGPTDEYLTRCDGSLAKEEFRFRTDSAGFIRSGEPAFDTDRIIVLGDSSAASLFVSESQRLGAVIERTLREAGRRADVLVGATSDCTTLHAVNIFLNKCLPLKPTQIIYMSCGSDGEALCSEAGYWLNEPAKALGPIAQAGAGTDEFVHDMPDLAARWAMLRVMLAAAEVHGTELVLVTVPHPRKIDAHLVKYYNNDFRYHERLVRMKHAINNCSPSFAREPRLACIDAELLSDHGEQFYDIVHLNQHGCETISEIIAERLLDSAAFNASMAGKREVTDGAGF